MKPAPGDESVNPSRHVELRTKFRLTGPNQNGSTHSGVEYRSRVIDAATFVIAATKRTSIALLAHHDSAVRRLGGAGSWFVEIARTARPLRPAIPDAKLATPGHEDASDHVIRMVDYLPGRIGDQHLRPAWLHSPLRAREAPISRCKSAKSSGRVNIASSPLTPRGHCSAGRSQ